MSDTSLHPRISRSETSSPSRSSLRDKSGVAKAKLPWHERQWQRLSRLGTDTWVVESCALSVSVLSAIAIGVVLWLYNGEPVPHLPHGVTLNAIVSVLANISKSNLLLVLGSAISQLKWVWYQRGRPLVDAEVFEEAARGPWGSLKMLFRHGVTTIASIGAAVLVLLTAFEPSIQQVLTYPNWSTSVNSTQAIANQTKTLLSDDMDKAISEAVGAGMYGGDFTQKPFCPASNCTWDPFPSLGLCSSCGPPEVAPILEGCDLSIDWSSGSPYSTTCNVSYSDYNVSSQITVAVYKTIETSPAYSNSTERTITYQMSAPDLVVTELFPIWNQNGILIPSNRTILGISNPLVAIGSVAVSVDLDEFKIDKAQTCVLSFCLQDHHVNVTNGFTSVETMNTTFGNVFHPPDSLDANFTVLFTGALTGETDDRESWWCWSPHDNVFEDPGVTSTGNGSVADGLNELSETWSRVVVADEDHFAFCSNTWFRKWGHIVVVSSSSDGAQQMHSMGAEEVLKNIAASITLLGSSRSPHTITGATVNVLPHVHVMWEWLILPGCLIVAGTAFFVATVLISRKRNARLWKNSILAAFFHGLDDRTTMNAPMGESVTEMGKVAEVAVVRLEEHNREGRTVLVNAEQRSSMRQRFAQAAAINPDEAVSPQAARLIARDASSMRQPRTW
ncbi:uncharacterized protein AB675_1615 [Cyphellophora attinorum]|uniref:Uncharacterized protein n=1 Tax=Cyphellophora attinorum TaxID=1664694 RepID=A0A0N1H585_9EURO|nr:uncharacterized protein AB675_1615 [Phialophora attinorum]KPI36104.1 hypothetical protein AB675_1615 [Phialophora attinorum]